MASIDLSPVRGTRDFPPEQMRLRTWLFEHWRAVAATHGFCEYDAPVVEHEVLYVRKAGEEITGQLYNFEDKGGRRLALRPQAVLIAQQLRARGRSVDLVLEDRKVKWAFKHADRIGARRMVLLGSREWDEGKVKVKDLQSGEQTLLAPEDL